MSISVSTRQGIGSSITFYVGPNNAGPLTVEFGDTGHFNNIVLTKTVTPTNGQVVVSLSATEVDTLKDGEFRVKNASGSILEKGSVGYVVAPKTSVSAADLVNDPLLKAAYGSSGRLSNFGGMVPAGGRAGIPQDLIGSISSQFNSYRVELTRRTAAVRLLYVNWCGPTDAERVGTADLVVRAKIGLTGGTEYRDVMFGGQTQTRIGPGGFMLSDPVSVDTSGVFWIRTAVAAYAPGTNTPAPGAIPRGPTPTADNEGTTNNAPITVDLTSTPAGDYQFMYCPLVVTSPPRTSVTSLIQFGDSIQIGQDDGPQSFYGWGVRFSLAHGVPVLKLAQGGSTASVFATGPGHARTLPLAEGASHATVGYGTNDLGTDAADAAKVQSVKASLVSVWTLVAGYVGKVAALTITPRATSTDNWATTANQTPVAANSARVQINDWIRAGAPIDPTSSAPVAIGTPGALLAGQAGHPLDRYIDMADAVETARNSGIIRANGGAWTYDGTHFSALGYQAMANAVPVGWFS